MTLEKALQRIKEGQQKSRVTQIRMGDKKKKQELPAVLFSGKFEERSDKALARHSGYIVLDFDHVNVPQVKSTLASDQYVFAVWVSPSGDGLKALVRVSNPERHRDHFRALCKYFDSQYGVEVDVSGINESRACYESYDEHLVQKDSEVFTRMVGEEQPEQTASMGQVQTDYNKLGLACHMIRKSQDGNKHNTLVTASYVIGGYIAAGRIEQEEAMRVMEREIEQKGVTGADLDHAKRTIRDGIEQGKQAPIHDVMEREEAALRELQLNDGDMSFISSDSKDLEYILDYLDGNIEVGLSTGNAILDQYFRFKREFVMINGHSNVGKTTFMLWMMVASAINHNWSWVIYSSENRTANIKLRLLQFATAIDPKIMNHAQVKKGLEWVKEHFTIIDNSKVLSYHEVLLYTEKIHRLKPIDGVLIDPYNSLKISMLANKGVGPHEYHYEAASEFLTFANKIGAAVWVNAHSITQSQRQKGEDGHPKAPGAEDTEHGGKWVNRSDMFVTVHRKPHHEDPDVQRTIEFHVRKVREVETGGKPTALDAPMLFRFMDDHSGYEMQGPVRQLFQPIQLSSVGSQLSTSALDF